MAALGQGSSERRRRKLKALRYGPFRILKKYGANAFQLGLPPYMSMYSVVNAEKLKLFEPSMLDEDEEHPLILPPMEDLDSIVERKVVESRSGARTRYRVGLKGTIPSRAKWYTEDEGRKAYPHLWA